MSLWALNALRQIEPFELDFDGPIGNAVIRPRPRSWK